MRVVRIGAQRASLRQRLTAVLAGTIFATVFGIAVGAANPAPAAAYTPPYYTVETYYLKLVNCTRTGGWVLKDGTMQTVDEARLRQRVAEAVLRLVAVTVDRRDLARRLEPWLAGFCRGLAHAPGAVARPWSTPAGPP